MGGVNSISLRIHFELTSISLRIHFDFTSISLRVPLISITLHFDLSDTIICSGMQSYLNDSPSHSIMHNGSNGHSRALKSFDK